MIELVCSQDCLTMKSLKITYPDVNISSFSASKSGYVGDSVTLKASVSSGTAPYEYQYSYDDNKVQSISSQLIQPIKPQQL